MKVINRFFDNNNWSIYATFQTIVPLILLQLGVQNDILKYLVMSSLIGMMEGLVIHKAIYSFFLSLMVWSDHESFVINTILTVISAILTAKIPYNHYFHKYVMSHNILLNIFNMVILIWMIFILYFIIKKLIYIRMIKIGN